MKSACTLHPLPLEPLPVTVPEAVDPERVSLGGVSGPVDIVPELVEPLPSHGSTMVDPEFVDPLPLSIEPE